MNRSSLFVTIYAGLLFALGGTLLFAPLSIGAPVDASTAASPILGQLLGAALIGFGATNWIARRAPLGGIYGRAVVLGNQMFSLIGALVLLRRIPPEPGYAFWLLLSVLALGAALHGTLLLRGPYRGSGTKETPSP